MQQHLRVNKEHLKQKMFGVGLFLSEGSCITLRETLEMRAVLGMIL